MKRTRSPCCLVATLAIAVATTGAAPAPAAPASVSAPAPAAPVSKAAEDPDGLVAFMRVNESLTAFDIWTIDPDAPAAEPDLLIENASYPTWSPDGRSIAYAGNVGDGFELFVADADGSDRRQLTFADGQGSYPWSWPSADALYYGVEGDPTDPDGEPSGALLAIDPTGTGAPRIFREPGPRPGESVNFPDVTTDGRVAFIGDFPLGDDRYRQSLYVAQGNGARDLVAFAAAVPDWDPNGQRLAYWQIFDGEGGQPRTHDLLVLTPGGSDAFSLTGGERPFGSYYPSWSPSATRVAWSNGATFGSVYVSDVATGDYDFLVSGSLPDWQPEPGDAPPPEDTVVAGPTLRGSAQRLTLSKPKVKVRAGAAEQVRLVGTGKARQKKKSFGLAPARGTTPGTAVTLSLKPKSKAVKQGLVKAVKKYRAAKGGKAKKLRVFATVSVAYEDIAGNSATRRVKILLK